MGGSGWNKPVDNQPRKAPKKPSAMRGVVAGLVVVALAAAAVCYVLFSGDKAKKPVREDTKKGLIKEVTPAAAPTNKPPTQAQKLKKRYPWLDIPDDWNKPYPPQAYWPDGRLKQHTRYVKIVTNYINDVCIAWEHKVFPEGGANLEIASLLTIEPGEDILGDYNYGDSFVKSFLRQLNTPIVVSKDDTDEAKALKEAVRQTRMDLKKRYDAGEDIAKIMNDSRKELIELSLYRQELDMKVAELRAENKGKFSAKDIRDLYGAANQMLEDRGCKPLTLPEMMLHKLELREARKAAQNKDDDSK